MRAACIVLALFADSAFATTDALRISVDGTFHKYGGVFTAINHAAEKTQATIYFTSESVLPIGYGIDTEILYDTIPWTVVYTDPKGTHILACVGNVPGFDGTYFLFHVECDSFPH